MVCNSLNFIWGSQQPDHFDTWYMPPPPVPECPPEGPLKHAMHRFRPPPPPPFGLAVSSICLEDVHPDAGPLMYYPGSHALET